MSRREAKTREGEYEVGYGKPPKPTRFKPGRSGNPRGRPKRRRNVHTILMETLYRPVTVTEKGRRKSVPAIEAMTMRLMKSALEGDVKAIDRIARLLPLVQGAHADEEAAQAAARRADPEADEALLAEFAEMLRETGEDER